MAENIPPGSAGKAAATSESTTRGLPYYEKLRRDLRDTLQKKRILDKNMAALEEQIYRQETSYLEETSAAGNIIKGFDNYIKSSAISSSSAGGAGGGSSGAGTISGSAAGGGGGPATGRRKPVINDADRVFSRSSTSYMRDSDSPSSATTTPNHVGTGTPTGSFAAQGAGGQSQGSSATPSVKGAGAGAGDRKKKKKKASTAAAAAAAVAVGEEESEADAKPPNKRARISYGPRE